MVFKLSYRFLVLFLLISNLSFAQKFEFNDRCNTAYDKIMSLRFDEASVLLKQEKKNNPTNLVPDYLENYIDFFKVFINEEKAEFDQLEPGKNKRLARIEKGDPYSPYFLFVQAEIRLQWALARLKFNEYFTAFTEVRKAYKLLEKNQKKYPHFVANKKSLGILHAMVGTIPDSYKWGVQLLGGMDGTIAQGKKELEEVLAFARKNEFFYEEETMVMYAFLMLHLNKEEGAAWNIVSNGKLNPRTNPLAAFVLGNVAMNTGNTDKAISILENRPRDAAFHPFHYLEFMLGLCKVHQLDPGARKHFNNYINNFKGQNYIKEAYQKTAWSYLVEGNTEQYYFYIKNCLTKGAASVGEDKKALKEAQSGTVPNVDLVKARLLFDGGYFKESYNLLSGLSDAHFTTDRTRLEYIYRKGRAAHGYNKMEEAIQYYNTTIEKGQYLPYYFACNAALKLGLLYEQQGQKSQAKSKYQLCLSMKPDEYKNGLHQQAKAGLNRLR